MNTKTQNHCARTQTESAALIAITTKPNRLHTGARRMPMRLLPFCLPMIAHLMLPAVSRGQAYQYFANSPGEASTILPVDTNADGTPDRMLTGDNEDENLRFYPWTGGATLGTAVSPSSQFIVTENGAAELINCSEATALARLANPAIISPNLLALTNQVNRTVNRSGSNNEDWNIRESDIEASARLGNRIYWLGSHSLAANGNDRPHRRRLFATDLNAAVPSLTFVNYYTQLREQLIAFDNTRPIARRYDLATAAANNAQDAVEGDSGFNIEALTPTEAGTLFLGFRSPLVDPVRHSNGSTPVQTHRTHALVVEVTNPAALIAGAGQAPSTANVTFGRTYELDLGGRGIRSMDFNGTEYVIIAGRIGEPAGLTDNYALFTWKPGNDPVLRYASIPTGFTAESVAILTTGSLAGAFNVRIAEDAPPPGDPADPRSQISTFRALDVAVPAAGAFHFAPIADVIVNDVSRGLQRRTVVGGFRATGGNTPSLTATILSGSTLVPSVTVVQPGGGTPNGELLYTPSNAGGVAASAEIRVTATITGGAQYTRQFKVYRFNSYRVDQITTGAPNGVALKRMNNLGGALGVLYSTGGAYYGQPMTWNQRQALPPASDLLTGATTYVDGFNDYGTTLGGTVLWLNGSSGPFTVPGYGGASVERLMSVNNQNRVIVTLNGDEIADRWVTMDLTGTVTGSQANVSQVTTIGCLFAGAAEVMDIDREGNVGGSDHDGTNQRAGMWTASNNYASTVLLPMSGGAQYSGVYAVSANGVAGGFQMDTGWIARGVVWKRSGPGQWATPVQFTLPHAYVLGVNDDLQAIMQTYDGTAHTYAVGDAALTGGSTPTWTFWGAGNPMPFIYVGALNNRGQIAGFFTNTLDSRIYTPIISN